MVKILIIIPPYVLGENNRGVKPNKAMLPVGPLVVAGQLRDRGHEVKVPDLVFEEEWWQALPLSPPDILLLSCHTVRNIPCCAAILDELVKMWSMRPHTILGGNVCLEFGIADFHRLGLQTNAVIRGFGHTLDVLEAIERRHEGDIWPKGVHGDIPLPALKLLPLAVHDQYRVASFGKYPMYGFGAGCHWYRQCGETHCRADMDSPWLPRSVDLVVQEFRLAKQYGYHEAWFVDNLLFTSLDAALAVDRAAAELGLCWSGMTRVELICKLPKGFLQEFNALTDVAMGVEAVSEDILQAIARSTKRHQILQAFRMVREAGKSATAFVILDLPKSTDQDFWRLMEFLEDLDQQVVTLDHKSFHVSMSFYNPPAREVVEGRIQPANMGFYRWPLGYSAVSPTRAVQHAMFLFGRWWKTPGWTPNYRNPFFETDTEFGVNFLEGRILQEKSARDPAGDLPEIWQEEK